MKNILNRIVFPDSMNQNNTENDNNPIIYYGGQIQENQRGDWSSVVIDNGQRSYRVISHLANSPEFIQLTGVQSLQCEYVRVYIGLSQEAARQLERGATFVVKGDDCLQGLDTLLVDATFLKNGSTQPKDTDITYFRI